MSSVYSISSFAVFLVIFLGIGSLAAKRLEKTDADYLLGSRSFGKYFVGLSAGATGNSGFIMTAAVGFGYTMGFSSLLMCLAFFIGEWLFWTFFSDKVNHLSRSKDSKTIPEMVGSVIRQPGGRTMVTSVVGLISFVLVGAYSAAQFAAAGKSLNVFFGMHQNTGAIIAAAAILCYCVSGGLRASIWTDIVQAFVVMFVSFGLLTYIIIGNGGVTAILQSLSAVDPKLVNIFEGHTVGTLIAYFIGFGALGLGFNLSQPQVLVRLLAGRSPREVRAAKWVYLGYIYSTWGAMTVFGIVCRIVVGSLADPEQALPVFAVQNFHPLLVGIILAGIFSVIASTADSQILVCSSALSRDIFPRLYRKMTDRIGVRYHQFATLVVGIMAVSATLCISSSVFTLILFAVGALAGSIGSAMLVILFKRPTHYAVLTASMLCGLTSTVAWRLLGWNEVLNEVVPGLIIGLVVHEFCMQFFFNGQIDLLPDVQYKPTPADLKIAANE